MPKPAGHIVQALHDIAPAFALKVPASQLAHLRSLLAVAMAVVYVPGAHGALTALHTAPLMAAENVSPTVHGAHWRSAVAEPALDCPYPTPHAVQTVHLSLPNVDLKNPSGQRAQTRSELVVDAMLMYWPGMHGAFTALQALPSLTSEKAVTPLQTPHSRFTIAEPESICPWPTGQTSHVVHAALSAVALKVPLGHVAHVRSDDVEGAASLYWPVPQGALTTWHGEPSDVLENVEMPSHGPQ